MKKSYLMIAAAAALFAACAEKDTFKSIESEDVLIGFETFHEKATKATATDAITARENLTKAHGGFGVWGYKGAPTSVGAATGSPATVDVSGFTTVFDNVQVWYENSTTPTRGFTYAVPKYWDKAMEYIFFAYAPYDATNASINDEKGIITIADIPSIQDVSTSTGSGQTLVFNGSTTTNVTDYLMATYVTDQKLVAENKTTTPDGTNQNYGDGNDIRYTGQQQTVGLTFGHMLSKLQINLQASEQYSGVEYIKVDALSIERMPVSSSTASFTQTSPTAPAGAYTPNTYSSELQVIGANGTSTSSLYILKDGDLGNDGVTITLPTKQNQSFNYYVAPNVADNSTTTDVTEKYLLNVTYTIHYVDNIEEEVTVEDVDLSDKLTALLQNNQYVLTIKIALNQIYFDVISITDWVTPINSEEIEIK